MKKLFIILSEKCERAVPWIFPISNNSEKKRSIAVKKITFTGLILLVSIMTLSALAFGEISGIVPPAGMPSSSGMGGHGTGSGMMMGHGLSGQGMEEGMMCQCGRHDRMAEVEHHLSAFFTVLNLDEQQKKSIREIKSTIIKETIRKMADIQIARIELQDLLARDPVDMKAVEAKVKQIGMVRTDMHLAHIRALEEIKSKLTAEQRKRLVEMIKSHPMMGPTGMRPE